MTDKERLDELQAMTKGYGNGWILRESQSGRGMRLHETGTEGEGVEPDIRDAIDHYIEANKAPNPDHCNKTRSCSHHEYCEEYECNWDKRGKE